jgi:radical SAM-linked protein
MELKSRIDKELLPFINKPSRFLGGEFNLKYSAQNKPSNIALCHAEVYEVGMGNVVFETIYFLMNSAGDGVVRCFYPGRDAEQRMSEKNIPLFVLETYEPLNRFPYIFFYIDTPLAICNVLAMLQLADIPFRRTARAGSEAPLLIACGPAMNNPEPFTAFFDAIVVGSPENPLRQMAEEIAAQPLVDSKAVRDSWKSIPGLYLPGAAAPGTRITAASNKIGKFASVSFMPLVALADTSYNRLDTQIATAPPDPTVEEGAAALRHAIWAFPASEVNFYREWQQHFSKLENVFIPFPVQYVPSSLSEYWRLLKDKWLVEEPQVTVTLPACRLSYRKLSSTDVALELKQIPFVLPLYAATTRLRNVINANWTTQDIADTIKIALAKGWKHIQLYFTIGLPTEKTEDIAAIAKTVHFCLEAVQSLADAEVSVVTAIFKPEPHTPFQWETMESVAVLNARQATIAEELSGLPVKLFQESPEVALWYTAVVRGDRGVADLIEEAFLQGSRFDGTESTFLPTVWHQAATHLGQNPENYRSAISITIPLPWDHIDLGVSRSHLKEEKLRGIQGQLNPQNKDRVSLGYGGMKRTDFERFCQSGATPHHLNLPGQPTQPIVMPVNEPVRFGRKAKKRAPTTPLIKRKVRLRYAKTGTLRFVTQYDCVRIFERCAKLAKIPLVYSQGLRRNPKLSYGLPLPTGISSVAEYLDMEIEIGREVDIANAFNSVLPEGLQILQYQGIFSKVPALASIINCLTYEVAATPQQIQQAWIDTWLANPEVIVQRPVKEGVKEIDIRPYVTAMAFEGGNLHITLRIIEGRGSKITEVLSSLLSPHGVDYREFFIQRTGQYIVDGEHIQTPFDVLF